ncbi:MAG: nuclear transport factor 2 family protein, partial [Pseudoclavibacter sp.]
STFNAGDFERLITFSQPEIDFVVSRGTVLTSPRQVVDHYQSVRTSSRRTMRIDDSFASGDRLAAEFISDFEFTEDAPEFPSGAAEKGDRLVVHTFVHYRLVDGLLWRARSATLERTWQRTA